jgi:hypothetical protein
MKEAAGLKELVEKYKMVVPQYVKEIHNLNSEVHAKQVELNSIKS